MRSSLAESLQKSLDVLELTDKDEAAVRLAIEYADKLDAGADAIKMGPAYLACLEALGMTPRARAAITGRGDPASGPGTSPLDQLRAKRAARAN